MSPEDRRRFGAVAALVLGVFLGLTLVAAVPTGPLGRGLGEVFWRLLGAGAVGLPLLGVGLGLAGFDRPRRGDLYHRLRCALFNSGVDSSMHHGWISAVHTEADIERTVASYAKAFAAMLADGSFTHA